MRRDTDGYAGSGGGTEPTAGGQGQSSRGGLASWLRELGRAAEVRTIEVGALSRPLKLALAITISGALLAGFFIFAQNAPQTRIGIFAGYGLPDTQMPVGAFVCGLLLWVIAWTFGLTGALHGHWSMRLLILAVFLYPISQSFVPDIHVAIFLAPIAVLYLWAILASLLQWRAKRARRAPWRLLPVVTAVVVSVTLTAYYVAFYLLSRIGAPGSTDFALLFTAQVQALSFVLLPILFLSGTDFTEVGVTVAGRASALLGRLRSSWVTPILVVGLAIVIFVGVLATGGFLKPFTAATVYSIAQDILLTVVCVFLALGIARLGRLRTWTARAIPPWAFVIAAVVTMASLAGPVVIGDLYISTQSTAPPISGYTVYQHTTDKPPMSFAYPSTWLINVVAPTATDDLLTVDTFAPTTARTYEFTLTLVPPDLQEVSDLQSATDVVRSFCGCTPTLTDAPDHGLWQTRKTRTVEAFTKTSKAIPQQGNLWWQRYGDNLFVVYAHTAPSDAKTYAPIFIAMLDSWRPDLSATAPVFHDTLPGFVTAVENWDPSGTLSLGLIPLLLGLLVGLPLLMRGREKPDPTNVAGLFLVIYGLREALLYYPQLLALAGIHAAPLRVWTPPGVKPVYFISPPTLSSPQLLAAVSAITIVMVARLVVRRRRSPDTRATVTLGLLLAINTGLLAIQLIYRFFDRNDQAGAHFPVLQAVALVGAFLWDLMTSGEQAASATDNRSPRYARLLLYLGYSMVSFTLIMYISVLNSSGTPFDTGDWTRVGISALGIPLLLTLFLMAITRENNIPVEKLMAGGERDDRPPEHVVPVSVSAQAPVAVYPAPSPETWRG